MIAKNVFSQLANMHRSKIPQKLLSIRINIIKSPTSKHYTTSTANHLNAAHYTSSVTVHFKFLNLENDSKYFITLAKNLNGG